MTFPKPADWHNVDESLVQLAAALELTINSLNNSFTFEDGSELFPTTAHRSYGNQRLHNLQRNCNWLAKLPPDWNPYFSLRLQRSDSSVAVPLTDIIQRNISRLHNIAMTEKSSRSKSKSSSSKTKTRRVKSHSPMRSSSKRASASVNFSSESDEDSDRSAGLATAFQRGCSTTANTPESLGYADDEVTYLKGGCMEDGKNILIPLSAKDKLHKNKSNQTDVVLGGWGVLRAPGSSTKFHRIAAEIVGNVTYKDGSTTSGIHVAYHSKLSHLKRNGGQLIKTIHRKAGYTDKNGGVLTEDDETPFVDGFNAMLREVESDSEDEDDKKQHLYVAPPVHTVHPGAPPDAGWGNNYWSSKVKSELNPNALDVTPDTYGETIEWKDTKGNKVQETHDENVLHVLLAVTNTEVATAKKKKDTPQDTEEEYAEWKEKHQMKRGA